MAGTSFVEAASAAGSRIGRYFGLVSAIPSALFVFFVYALIKSGAWSSEPNTALVGDAVRKASLGQISVLIILSIALGLALHPLQFGLIQLLEGYWGTSRLARWLAAVRTRHHRARWAYLEDQYGEAALQLGEVDASVLGSEAGDPYIRAIVDEQAFRRASKSYPMRGERILPTRLGNVLRRFEDEVGTQYGLDLITIGPHLALCAEPGHAAYMRDAREQLDLAVRLCVLSLLASAIAFSLLVTDGWWLLVSLAPYALAYLFYRGAAVAAADYGTVLATVLDLNRFRLYGKLHMPMPSNTTDERDQNAPLIEILRFKTPPVLRYTHPPDTSVELSARRVPPDDPAS